MDQAQIQWTAELISLSLTFPTVVLGSGVLYKWGPSAYRAARRVLAEGLSADNWFIVGVVSAFLGSVLDNLYWGLAWSAAFYKLEIASDLFAQGVFYNIVFRQAAGIFAAYCHLRAAQLSSSKGPARFNWLLVVSYLGAGVVAVILWLTKAA